MQIQVVIEKSAKPTPEFLAFDIPSGNRHRNAYTLPLAPLPQFFCWLPPPPGKRAKPLIRRRVTSETILKSILYFANTSALGIVPEAAVSGFTNILHFLFTFCL